MKIMICSACLEEKPIDEFRGNTECRHCHHIRYRLGVDACFYFRGVRAIKNAGESIDKYTSGDLIERGKQEFLMEVAEKQERESNEREAVRFEKYMKKLGLSVCSCCGSALPNTEFSILTTQGDRCITCFRKLKGESQKKYNATEYGKKMIRARTWARKHGAAFSEISDEIKNVIIMKTELDILAGQV